MRNESGKFVKSCIIMRRGAELILENYGCFFGNLDFFFLRFPARKRTFLVAETYVSL